MDDEVIRQEVATAYEAYLAAFLANDMAGIDRVVKYPLAFISDGDISLVDSYPVRPAELMARTGWDHTTDNDYEIVAASPEKAHVILRNAKRRRRDGSLIETISAFYAFTRTREGWKMFAFSGVTRPAT
ncbi:MAG: hypothetical protein AB7O57_15845 [Hyphomicrobiaceae bacterium]